MSSRATTTTYLLLVYCGVTASVLLGCSTGAVGPVGREHSASESSAIIGGNRDADNGAVVGLQISLDAGGKNFGLCSGSVFHVSGDFALVLTAAHCVAKEDAKGLVALPVGSVPVQSISVFNGEDPVSNPQESTTFFAAEVHIAAGFDGYTGSPNDVAIVRITGPVDSLDSLPISKAADSLKVGDQLTLVGYGADESGAYGARRVTNQTVSTLTEKLIGIDQSNGSGICSGDSGGPILVVEGGHRAITGVNSFVSAGAHQPCAFGYGVRIPRFESFLSDAIAGVPLEPDSIPQVDVDAGAPSPFHSGRDGSCAFSESRSPRPGVLLALVVCVALAFGRRRSGQQ